ncbi:MAG: cell cycle protein [Thermomicrobiales bacterium]|nr:cell cycle protein [Thermomicrobiales bacterium]
MIVPTDRIAPVLFASLPSLTLVAGIGATATSAASIAPPDGRIVFALAMAAVAPIAAMAVLGIVAPRVDFVLVAVVGMLVAIGLSALYRLSLAPGIDGAFYSAIVTRHALFVAAGFLALAAGVLAERGIDRARRYPFTLLAAAIALTVSTVIFGETVNGARLWLDAGPLRFQPSEVARFLIAMFVAVYLYERRHLLTAPWNVRGLDLPPAPYLLPLAVAVVIAVSVLIFQNDLGMAALVVLGAGATVVSVVRSRAAVLIVILLLSGGLAGAYLAVPRVRDRVFGWLEPWQDPAGRGFQFVQADFSLAAGGFQGDGGALSAGSVPEVHTDLVLIAVSSQFGVLIGAAVLALVAVLVCRCMIAGLRAGDGFRALVAIGLAVLIAIQVILITGGSLRVLPLTGLTFPLVSYGGTSMIVTQFALGIVLGIGANSRAGMRSVVG